MRDAGVTPLAAGPTFAEAVSLADRRFAELSFEQRYPAMFSQIIAPAKLVDLERIVAEWQPDLVVHECTNFAAPLAAAVANLRTVTQGWGLVPLPGVTVPDPADVIPFWRSHGLEPAAYSGIFGKVHLHPMPPSLEPEARVPVGRLQPMRLDIVRMPDASLPADLQGLMLDRRPVVYVSLGTVDYFSRPEFFAIILKGLAALRVVVVATVGQHNDPSALGPQPENVHLERWLPLSAVLRRCSLVVCHAGSGTMLASLAAGLPLVLLPRGADQFQNASAGAVAGVARVIPPEGLTSAAVATEVQRVPISHCTCCLLADM
ncbi:MAG: hypothetical protein JOZ87_37295 [Chloroflexi bacterium]|nr:hypothetical protein [Chloroflexota bacterium]